MRIGRLKQPGAAPAQSLYQGAQARAHLLAAALGLVICGDRARRGAQRATRPPDRRRSLKRQGVDSERDHALPRSARGGARRMPLRSLASPEKARNGNWRYLKKLAWIWVWRTPAWVWRHSRLGFDRHHAWARRARLGRRQPPRGKTVRQAQPLRRPIGGRRGPQIRPDDPASTSAGAPKDMNSDWRRGLDCAGLDIPAEPGPAPGLRPGPDLVARLERNGLEFLREEISYCRTGRERLCFVRDLFRQDRDSLLVRSFMS